nr:hypothetical protein Q903MT_gene114 [Picea sitchensis]
MLISYQCFCIAISGQVLHRYVIHRDIRGFAGISSSESHRGKMRVNRLGESVLRFHRFFRYL